MPNYQEYACPVCKVKFEKDDDIVTCPECGTPHHRECYKLLGKCVNNGLHQSGYSFLESEKVIPPQKIEDGYYVPPTIDQNIDDTEEEIEQIVPERKSESQKGGKGFSPFGTIGFDTDEYKGTGKIGEYDVSDVAATVRTNVPRFVKKFRDFEKSGRKTSWNWSAFFFGEFYLLFRKMYKQGIAVYCVILSIIFGFETLIFKMAPNAMAQMQKILEDAYASGKRNIDLSALNSIADMQTATKLTYLMLGAIILVRIIVALFADNIYKNTVFNIIKKMDEKIDDGANFTQTTMVFGQVGTMDQNQMRKMYLGGKGGVSIFAPLLAYTFFQFILTFI